MGVDISWWAVILATASSMAVGSIWYARPVFGNMWAKLAGVKLDSMAGKGATQAIITTIIVSFITAFVLAHMTFLSHAYFHGSYMQDAVTTAFWGWLGLTAARFITHDAFERRPVALTALNCAHELITLLIMGLIIGLFPVS
jgi:hypothetical protein